MGKEDGHTPEGAENFNSTSQKKRPEEKILDEKLYNMPKGERESIMNLLQKCWWDLQMELVQIKINKVMSDVINDRGKSFEGMNYEERKAIFDEFESLKSELKEAAAAAEKNPQDENLQNQLQEVARKINTFKTEKLNWGKSDWPEDSGQPYSGAEDKERGGEDDKDDMRRRFTIGRVPHGKSAFRGFGGSGRGAGGGARGKW
jgi:hypothetical protein